MSLAMVATLGTALAIGSQGLAQAPQGTAPAGRLTPATTNAEAVTELRAALDGYFGWQWKSAAQHSQKALELDPGFGLARSLNAILMGGPRMPDELRRGATDAAGATAGEALLALGSREQNQGRPQVARRIFAVARELMPRDPHVALWGAVTLADTVRVNAFRAAATAFPDNPSIKALLAFFLTPSGFDSIIRANAAEAERVAEEGVRLAPQASQSHAALAHVLTHTGRYDEARRHLARARSLSPVSEYAYELEALIAAQHGHFAEQRAFLDSAGSHPNVATSFNYRRGHALTYLAEGDAQRALDELTAQAGEAEALGARGVAALTHLFMAAVSAGTRDGAGAEQHLAAARALGPAPATLADYEVLVYSVSGNAAAARRALGDYVRLAGPQPQLSAGVNATRTANVHRMTGMVLLAERKPQEAIAELKQGGTNPYNSLGIIEAYLMMGNAPAAEAERAAFFERRQFSWASTGAPIIRYRGLKK